MIHLTHLSNKSIHFDGRKDWNFYRNMDLQKRLRTSLRLRYVLTMASAVAPYLLRINRGLFKKKDIQDLQAKESSEDGGWHDLVSRGFIEYFDSEEEETTMISMTINEESSVRWLQRVIGRRLFSSITNPL